MVMRSRLRYRGSVFFAFFVICLLLAAPRTVSADPLDQGSCDRLETERQALIVLGIDNYFEKGSDWAKANLTVADLNLVKRYLNVYEQLKFRCQEEIDIVDADEPDDEIGEGDDTVSNGPVPPLPVRRPSLSEKASAASGLSGHNYAFAAAQRGSRLDQPALNRNRLSAG